MNAHAGIAGILLVALVLDCRKPPKNAVICRMKFQSIYILFLLLVVTAAGVWHQHYFPSYEEVFHLPGTTTSINTPDVHRGQESMLTWEACWNHEVEDTRRVIDPGTSHRARNASINHQNKTIPLLGWLLKSLRTQSTDIFIR